MQIIDQIAEKAGISAEQSQVALNTVLDTLKDKLPHGIGEQLHGLFEGKEFSMVEVATDKLEDLKDKAMDTLGNIGQGAKDLLDKVF